MEVNQQQFTVGQRVICNGYEGRVIRVLSGQLAGMIEVRLARGDVCVDASDELAVRPA